MAKSGSMESASPPGPPEAAPYPVQFDVDYPDRPLNRVTTFFRGILAIPILVVLSAVSGALYGADPGNDVAFVLGSGGYLFAAPALMLVFRRKYPRWWFDWNLELLRFSSRVWVYLLLMDDRYPSTDEQQSVHLTYPYPDAPRELNRWLPLVKWLLALPHYVVLALLSVAAFLLWIAAWFAVVFTGRYPRGIFDFQVGVGRWCNRVWGYAFTLVTDRYPPFRLRP